MHLPQSVLLDRAPGSFEALLAAQCFERRDFDLSRLLLPTRAWKSFTPVFTNLTTVGSPTLTGRYIQGDGKVFFQVKIVPGTTAASTAGSTYFGLPTVAGAEGITGDGSMIDLTTKISVGVCAFDIANSRCYTPTQGATADNIVIAGWYEG